MENISASLTTGIIAGIIASSIVGFALLVFQKIIVPWIKDLLYTGINLKGHWRSISVSHQKSELHNLLTFSQRGENLKGDYIVTYSIQCEANQNEVKRVLNLKVSGIIRGSYVQISFSSKDDKHQHLGAMTLKVKDGGRKLTGRVIYVSRDGEIGEMEDLVTFEREENHNKSELLNNLD